MESRGVFNSEIMYLQKVNNDVWLARLARTLEMKLTASQGNAVRLLAAECDSQGITDARQVSYVLATCYHECRFKSIPEIRAKKGTNIWKMQNRYWYTGFFGRGFSQLTWLKNYRKFSPVVGVDLVKNPDAALIPEVGAKILVFGMLHGTFVANGLESGIRLSKYFPPGGTPLWMGARRIVNGNFQAVLVAEAAKKILPMLTENTI